MFQLHRLGDSTGLLHNERASREHENAPTTTAFSGFISCRYPGAGVSCLPDTPPALCHIRVTHDEWRSRSESEALTLWMMPRAWMYESASMSGLAICGRRSFWTRGFFSVVIIRPELALATPPAHFLADEVLRDAVLLEAGRNIREVSESA